MLVLLPCFGNSSLASDACVACMSVEEASAEKTFRLAKAMTVNHPRKSVFVMLDPKETIEDEALVCECKASVCTCLAQLLYCVSAVLIAVTTLVTELVGAD